ncbi:pentapeptide repeat-containing protein [Streptomyces sp. NBC_00658]|uniref:pentapeptide repeat-containing protein n=1 Tax=Streptomyces sp. NBC_00658 TaxID=2975800 RepID=UPI00324F8D9D
MKPKVKQVAVSAAKTVTAVLVAVAVFWCLIVVLSWLPWAVEGDNARDKTLQPGAGILITGFRTTLVAVLAGLIALGSLYLAYRNHGVAREQLGETQKQFALAQQQFAHTETLFEHTREKDREQAELTREGQVTGRYVEAIKLLASDNVTERLGGIYSLERIIRDSEKDHPTIVEVLAAFIRQRAGKTDEDEPDDSSKKPDDDVQAALTVLGRRPIRNPQVIDLRGTDLRGASMADANFDGVDLRSSLLQRASLARSSLRRASFNRAILDQADFFGADLTEADLHAAHMSKAALWKAQAERAIFAGASMGGVDLTDAQLAEASFINARMPGCNLLGADLTNTCLDGTDLTGAKNLTPEQIADAKLELSTKLPAALTRTAIIERRMEELRAEEGDGEASQFDA